MTDRGSPKTVRSDDSILDQVDVNRLMIFVPAVMSVGLLFSAATVIRDLLRRSGSQARDRRTAIESSFVLHRLLDDDQPEPNEIGALTRPSYLITALVLVGGAAYLTIGATANFLRDGGYVSDIGWLLAVSLALAAFVGFLGGVSLVVFWSWPTPPRWTLGSLRTAPLTVMPGQRQAETGWTLGALVALLVTITALLTLMVGSGRSIANEIDEPIARWIVEATWIEQLSVIDPYGRTIISIAFVSLIGLAAFRCRVIAIVYPIAFLVSWGASTVIRELVERPRPSIGGDFESFPSGHLVQAVFIAGLVPLAIEVLFLTKRVAVLAQVLLGLAVVASALYRIHEQHHWPLDSLTGITIGLAVVLGVYWAVQHPRWHRRCSGCPWSPSPHEIGWHRAVLDLEPTQARIIGLIGAGLAVALGIAFIIASRVVGLPTDPEGFGFGSSISAPIQLGLASLLIVAGLLALRWRATAAILIALAALGLGMFAAVQYEPWVTVVLASAVLVPAVLVWLAWQPSETVASIIGVAAVTAILLGSTFVGGSRIYDFYFGPTHPASAAVATDTGEAEWLWLGAVGADTATIVAGGLEARDEADLWDQVAEGAEQRAVVLADASGIARFVLGDLPAGTDVRYAVDEAGELTGLTRVDGAFRTNAEGPSDLVVVAGSCARTGSNGAVFDAMVAENPDLYLAIGDLHYSNLDSADPDDHLAAYRRTLSSPGQAALFSSVPTAYVWDDHDYGPNDADGSSPSRVAVSTAYRQAVPHHGVDPDVDAPIAQAFTVGRIRFVLSDTRSQRTASSMLGEQQLAWLIDELVSSAETHGVVVWANPTPWISDSGADNWGNYPEERQQIADALARAQVDNVVMVSGDAHMVAIDDGTNSGYASDGSRGFPVLHAAALDRPGSIKGGPYSHGAFPGSGQYGRLEITDDGGPVIGVRLSGHTWDRQELVSLDLEFPAP
jgi:membrane-associated phospholipid phosphatase